MFFGYKDCIEKYKSDYYLEKAIQAGQIHKVEKGVYSDSPSWSDVGLVSYKNVNSVFTMESAFYYQNLTDAIPDNYVLGTDRNAAKIHGRNIKQYFYPHEVLMLGVEEKKVFGTAIRVYTKERMLIELIRRKNKLPFDYYKEIVANYRNKVYELDVQWLEENVTRFPASKKIMDTIQLEIF
mgnify:CR=1 FL=1